MLNHGNDFYLFIYFFAMFSDSLLLYECQARVRKGSCSFFYDPHQMISVDGGRRGHEQESTHSSLVKLRCPAKTGEILLNWHLRSPQQRTGGLRLGEVRKINQSSYCTLEYSSYVQFVRFYIHLSMSNHFDHFLHTFCIRECLLYAHAECSAWFSQCGVLYSVFLVALSYLYRPATLLAVGKTKSSFQHLPSFTRSFRIRMSGKCYSAFQKGGVTCAKKKKPKRETAA